MYLQNVLVYICYKTAIVNEKQKLTELMKTEADGRKNTLIIIGCSGRDWSTQFLSRETSRVVHDVYLHVFISKN